MRTSRSKGIVVAYCITALGIAAAVSLFSSSLYRSEAKEKARTAAVTGGSSGTFTNTTAIPIADSAGFPNVGLGNPYPSVIAVSGLSGTTVDVNVTLMGVGHTFPGDIGLLLVSPSGQFMVLQSDVGGSTDMAGVTYTLDDQAGGPIPSPISAGTYLPTSNGDDDIFPISGPNPPPNDCFTGGPGSCPQPAPAGSATLNTVFGGADPNGNWRLYAVDCCGLDTGGISGGWSITITTTGGPAGLANVDRNGDGITDYGIVRDPNPSALKGETSPLMAKSVRERMEILRDRQSKQTGTESLGGPPPVGTGIDWYFSLSGGGGTEIASFGEFATDFLVPTDFDGDGEADIAVWRSVNQTGPGGGYFYIFRSLDSTVEIIDLGIQGDDPTVSGDYDGDGTADPAVFRCPISVPGQCFYFYIASSQPLGGSNITFVPWGFGQSFSVFPNIGDFDGDGRHDFCVQTTHPNFAGQGLFTLLRSSDLGVEYVPWGRNTDLIAPGDYDGDGRNDFAVVRIESGQLVWYILEKDGGTRGSSWGLSSDFVAQGDYDGDGLTDVAIYRSSEGNWYVVNSSNGTVTGYDWGEGGAGDYPLSNWQVH